MGKTAIWTIFCFSPLPPLTMLRLNEYNLPQATLWVRNIKLRNNKKQFSNVKKQLRLNLVKTKETSKVKPKTLFLTKKRAICDTDESQLSEIIFFLSRN